MPEVHQPDCLAAWQDGVRLLRESQGELFNLITTIDAPHELENSWLESYSPNSIIQQADKLSDVVDTVFPISLRSRFPERNDFYSAYMIRHRRAMRFRRNRGKWGSYFERLISFGGTTNQLEIAITKLQNWPRNTTGLVFHLSCPTLDSPRTRGGPCWHFGELVWKQGDILDFVVVYRNHDFFNKAFGNFISLGQLLQFIAQETGKSVGKLICHSVHAYSDRSIATISKLADI